MNATIKRLGPNLFEVAHPDGLLSILISYETPVAVKNAEGRVSRTKTRWSRSTEAHISKWSRGAESGGDWLQENLDQLLVELIGSARLEGKAAAAKLGRTVDTQLGIDGYDAHTEPGDRNLAIPVYRR